MIQVDQKYVGRLASQLHDAAIALREAGLFKEALKSFFLLSERDDSYDAGGYAYQIGLCFEGEKNYEAAREWYLKAFEEGPFMDEYKAALERITPKCGSIS